MLIKAGVDISRLERPVRRALNTIETGVSGFRDYLDLRRHSLALVSPTLTLAIDVPTQNVSRRGNQCGTSEIRSRDRNFDVIDESSTFTSNGIRNEVT